MATFDLAVLLRGRQAVTMFDPVFLDGQPEGQENSLP